MCTYLKLMPSVSTVPPPNTKEVPLRYSLLLLVWKPSVVQVGRHHVHGSAGGSVLIAWSSSEMQFGFTSGQ